jgi:membrane protein insertase Oxa1/YidC/SpoIIIJ
MLNIFYSIFIFPIEQLIELSYLFIYRIFNNPAVSLLGVSFAVSVLTLPLYFMAEKHQRFEQDIQKCMKPEVDNIKAVFSGDERFMRLAVYYRQNMYHPLSSLRSSISLIIQIPFFIAAYHFISNLELIKNISLGPINDLAKPDSLIVIKGFTMNILPIVMTIISCVAAGIYTKGFSVKDKLQLYGMAVIFLILLYNSPSGLVLYWTGNNLFSLIKNFVQKMKNSKKIVSGIIIALYLFLFICFLLFTNFWTIRRIILVFIFISLPLLLFIYLLLIKKNIQKIFIKFREEYSSDMGIYLLSIMTLFLVAGLVIPSSLIASSVQEFSFIENYRSPFPFIINTVMQSIGIFVFWPLCIYLLLPKSYKKIFEKLSVIITIMALINVFIFPGEYGSLSIILTFSEDVVSGINYILINLFVNFILAIILLYLLFKFKKMMRYMMSLLLCALILVGIINNVKIFKDFRALEKQLTHEKPFKGEPVYKFSKTGKNVLVIMLDRAISGYIPYIFEEKPELHNSFDGFTWYKNTISFGSYTIFGVPGVFGGYEYTPMEIQKRENISLVKKHNEAILLLPRIFLDHGYNVTVTDPSWSNYKDIPDLSIFTDYPQIDAKNIIGKYSDKWLLEKGNDIKVVNLTNHIESNLIVFSFFKIVPLIMKNFIYDSGNWLAAEAEKNNFFPKVTINNYIALDILPKITLISDNINNSYNIICNELTHEPIFLQFPDYILTNEVNDIGSGPFANEKHYHANISAFVFLGKWFSYLKENNIYDNTKIIIVSDHGRNLYSKFSDNIILPDGNCLQTYTALLMVKNFNAHGNLFIDDTFMTNADVPIIALKDIVDNPINPWTGNLITSNKDDGVIITTSNRWYVFNHYKNKFNIKSDEWLHVHTNIYSSENWKYYNQSR